MTPRHLIALTLCALTLAACSTRTGSPGPYDGGLHKESAPSTRRPDPNLKPLPPAPPEIQKFKDKYDQDTYDLRTDKMPRTSARKFEAVQRDLQGPTYTFAMEGRGGTMISHPFHYRIIYDQKRQQYWVERFGGYEEISKYFGPIPAHTLDRPLPR